MIALHDVNGNLTYFIGGQSDLTEAMTTTRGPVSLLQSGEEIFNTDLNQLSEPVLLEAREAATNHDGLEIELPVGTTGGPSPSEKENNEKHDHHGFEKVSSIFPLAFFSLSLIQYFSLVICSAQNFVLQTSWKETSYSSNYRRTSWTSRTTFFDPQSSESYRCDRFKLFFHL